VPFTGVWVRPPPPAPRMAILATPKTIPTAMPASMTLGLAQHLLEDRHGLFHVFHPAE
jgi:hypothetical protein